MNTVTESVGKEMSPRVSNRTSLDVERERVDDRTNHPVSRDKISGVNGDKKKRRKKYGYI